MPLVFAAITPHTPVLMPTIGKDGLKIIEKTKQAIEKVEEDLYVTNPETLLVITPHGESLPDTVCLNLNSRYVTNFTEFGDVTTKQSWKSDILLTGKIREDFKHKHMPMTMVSSDFLDYGSAIPLHYLTKHLPNIRIVPITTAPELSLKEHYEIGRQLKDEIMSSVGRIAIIASADLSHRVSDESPAGLSPHGVAFDEKIIDILSKKNPIGILDIEDDWLSEAQSCGARVLAVLAGLMENVQHTPSVLSYEKPFGIGYMVADLKIK